MNRKIYSILEEAVSESLNYGTKTLYSRYGNGGGQRFDAVSCGTSCTLLMGATNSDNYTPIFSEELYEDKLVLNITIPENWANVSTVNAARACLRVRGIKPDLHARDGKIWFEVDDEREYISGAISRTYYIPLK